MLTNKEKKQIRSLQIKKYRKQYGEYLVEGARLISSALEVEDTPLKQIYATETFLSNLNHQEFIETLRKKEIPFCVVSEADLLSISDTVHPSGIAGVCSFSHKNDIKPDDRNNWLYLFEMQDPGNLGTLLRTAVWFDVNHIALSPNSIDPFNAKVIRAGMGAHFHTSIFEPLELSVLKKTHTILGGVSNGASISSIETIEEPWILAIGSEAHGLSAEIINSLDFSVSIPKIGGGESLNAAIAGSILLYELTGQNP